MNTKVKDINIEDYDYPLPDERIAKYPLPERDASKLLIFNGKNIRDAHFRDICRFLPEKSLLVLNETKVVRARLSFRKESGAAIEIFCLDPVNDDYQVSFASTKEVRWHCLVGNSRRWHDGILSMPLNINGKEVILNAERIDKNDESSTVRLFWSPEGLSFAEVLEAAGEVPLPPYLHRDAETSDRERYQTVFAHYDGSVAAPTASLHLTEKLIGEIKAAGHDMTKITLHVGAGTFRPVSTDKIGDHQMHSETIILKKNAIEEILKAVKEKRTVIPVGTTSMRTLESLYWLGVMIKKDGFAPRVLHVSQWVPYQDDVLSGGEESLETVLKYLEENHLDHLQATTSLMIAPSCPIMLTKGLITNFHQPKSTLLLLVSALIGERWKECYRYALENDFRFLSYGDSCLFLSYEL